ncbi:MAG: MATE family efflux transporter [Candidatus Faecivicinus sp.]|nr:MATE family efflux transporter [Candidatus Faecivicinus sp.]
MDEQKQLRNGIVEGVIWKELLKFFFPIMLGTLFQQLYNTVDTVVVGQFVGSAAVAAVGGSSAQILSLILGFFVGVSSGATVIVSQYFGCRDEKGVSDAVHTGLMLAILGGAIMTVLGLVCAPTLLNWMDTPADTLEDSAMYLRIVFLSMIPSMLYNVGSSILRAVGDSKSPLIFLIVCCLLNVALDLLFVIVFKMGVAGVAIATSLAQLASGLLVCWSLMRSKECYRLELKKLRIQRQVMRDTIRIGLPTGLQSMMYTLSNMIITTAINGFGTSVAAAWVVLGKLDGMNWMIVNAFGVAVMTFAGQNFGARRYDRVEKSMYVCVAMSMGTAIVMGASFMIFARPLFRLFTRDAIVLEKAVEMVRFMGFCYWLYIPIEMISGTLRGMGDALIPTAITVIGICALRAVWVFAVVPVWHTEAAIMCSYPISWVLCSVTFVFYYRRYRRTHFPCIEGERA